MDRRGSFQSMFVGLPLIVGLAVVSPVFGQNVEAPTPTAQEEAEDVAAQRAFDLAVQERTGDFDMMLETRAIRVLVPYSRTLYFSDRGRERGVAAQNIRDFEGFLNKKYKKQLGNRPITIVAIPTTRDLLLTNVVQGKGDIAAGNLTVTDERLKLVDFVAPEGLPEVSELLVTGPTAPPIATIDDLAGKKVHVRKTSSYYESLSVLNARFQQEGKPAIEFVLVPEALEDEDMMEMMNAGLIEAIVVDNWKAKAWALVLPKIKVREDIAVRTGGRVGWAIRKDSPKLTAEILDFWKNFLDKNNVVEQRLAQFQSRIKQIKDPTKSEEYKRFQKTLDLFEKYAQKYEFDPLMLAAQGYQESALNQEARSHVGAIGIMQVMPATGAELAVGDINVAESNVHAGTKYMDQLMERYFKDAHFEGMNRTLFAFASYNCGPGNVSRMRKLAEKRGLDPNVWFNNVEVITAEKIGIETTTYVRNIFKYYTAYKLTAAKQAEALKARETIATPTPEPTPKPKPAAKPKSAATKKPG